MTNFTFALCLVGLSLLGCHEAEAKSIDGIGHRFRRAAAPGFRGLARIAGGKRGDDGLEAELEGLPEDAMQPEGDQFVTREDVCGHNHVWSILGERCVPLNLSPWTGSFQDDWGNAMPKRGRSSWTNQNKGGKGFSIGRALGK